MSQKSEKADRLSSVRCKDTPRVDFKDVIILASLKDTAGFMYKAAIHIIYL